MAQTGQRIQDMLVSNEIAAYLHQAFQANPWFTEENTRLALERVVAYYLNEEALNEWVRPYTDKMLQQPPKTLGIVMAGNIPMAGLHDLLSGLLCGHYVKAKTSQRDRILIGLVAHLLAEADVEFEEKIQLQDTGILLPFDAVIATGSSNTSRYFEHYFGAYPSIIRKNRNGVALLTGEETETQLQALGRDVFEYFGLGCRSVSKLMTPPGYDFSHFFEANRNWKAELFDSDKYKNNYDYVKSILLMNGDAHLDSGYVLLKESESAASAIASLHYQTYQDDDEANLWLSAHPDEIQIALSQDPERFPATAGTPFGTAQLPRLWDYADDIDTLAFLTSLEFE